MRTSDSEYVLVEFNALVLNVNSSATINQGTDNQTGVDIANNRQNDVTLRVNGATIGSTSPNVTVDIAEPAITTITKSVSPATGPYLPGDGMTYTLSFGNTTLGNNNAATAFDVVLSDTFDSNLTLGTVNISSTQGASCIGGRAFIAGDSIVGQLVTVNVSCLDPGKTVTVTINAAIAAATTSGTTIANSSGLTYTSLPGTQGTCATAPFTCTGIGTSGSGTGERNGSDGSGADGSVLNNYAVTSNTVNTAVNFGSITIVLNSIPDHAQDFSFTGLGAGGYNFGGGFSLDDDTDGTLPNTRTFIPLIPGTYTLTQGSVSGWSLTDLVCIDPDSGSTTDLGTATATMDLDAGENVICTYTDTQLIPSIVLTKTPVLNNDVVAPNGISNAGDTITYTFSVENTGNVTISNVDVTDALLPTLSCSIASLAPGATLSCAAINNIYTLTQTDIETGSRANTATATGKDPGNNDVTDSDTKTITLTQTPALTIVKSVTETSYANAGDVLHYSYLVTNSGNVTLDGPFSVTDDQSIDETCPATATLAPGANITCTATYTVGAGDMSSGSVTNVASAHGSFGGNAVDLPTDTKTVNLAAAPSIVLTKTPKLDDTVVAPSGEVNVGDTITYSFSVENTGNVTVTNISVTDPLLPALSCTIASLALGETSSCTATSNVYTLTQIDIELWFTR